MIQQILVIVIAISFFLSFHPTAISNTPVQPPPKNSDDADKIEIQRLISMLSKIERHQNKTSNFFYRLYLANLQGGPLLQLMSQDKTRDDAIQKIYQEFLGKNSTRLKGHESDVHSAKFSTDGKHVVSASSDHTVRIWDLTNGKSTLLKGHTDWVTSAIFIDGGRIASSSFDGRIIIWDIASRKALVTLKGEDSGILSLAFLPNSKKLASVEGKGLIRFWDLANACEMSRSDSHKSTLLSVAISPDELTLATSGYHSSIALFSTKTMKEQAQLSGHDKNWVYSVAFSPDGKLLASAGEDSTVRIWDIASQKEKLRLVGHDLMVRAVAFSPKGNLLASGGYDKSVRLWDVQSGKLIKTLEGHAYYINSVDFSPDGTSLVSSGGDLGDNGEILLWKIGHAVGQFK